MKGQTPCDPVPLHQHAELSSDIRVTAGVRDTMGVRHGEVIGSAYERQVGGQRYAIRFRLRMPADWNGRFLFQGGGGTDGVLFDALGSIGSGLPNALQPWPSSRPWRGRHMA